MSQINTTIKLLTDLPVDKDNFGGHNRVADAIIELIQNEEGGKSIALTGHWGSGKSSIVKMIKNKFGKNGFVFVFDAWAHESDPLRRSFLEKLIHFCDENNLVINQGEWNEKLNELTKRKETTNTREIKTPTIYGLILLFITALIPLSFFILSLWPNINWAMLIISLSVIALPAAITLVAIIMVLVLKKLDWRKKILSLLSTDADVTVDTETFRTNDPTTIEFQKYFFDLMNDIYKNIDNKKILIVMDNLDRIESEDAMKMWATMRTFFEFDSPKEKLWIKDTWLLVPYDFSGLIRLWNDRINVQAQNEDKVKDDLPLVHSFTEKTFQISFETPLFVSSDTFEYFKENFERALPGYNRNEEVLLLYNVFKELRRPNLLPPTPREIILFINNLTAIYRQRKDEVPLHIQGIYVIKRKCEWQNDQILIKTLQNFNAPIVDSSLTELADSDLREYLAALYFNTEKENALQLLLSEGIESAIKNANEKYFEEIGSSKGISIICYDIIRKEHINWANTQSHILGNACFVLSSLAIEEDGNLKSAWHFLAVGVKNVKKWTNLDIKSGDGICSLLNKFNEKSIIEHVLVSLSNSPELFDEHKKVNDALQMVSKDEKQIIHITEAILKILNIVSTTEYNQLIKEKFRINSQPGTYLKIIKAIMNSNFPELAKHCLLSKEVEKLIPYIIENINTGIMDDIGWYTTVKHLNAAYLDLNWDELVTTIDTRLRDLNKPTPTQVELLIHVLYLVKDKNKNVENILKNLIQNGFILHQFQKAFQVNNFKSAANCLLCITDYALNGAISMNNGESAQGINRYNTIMKKPEDAEEVINEFILLLKEFDRIEHIFEIRNLQENFSGYLLKVISKDKDLTNLITSNKLIEKEIDLYTSLDEDEYLNIVKKYVYETELVVNIVEGEFSVDLATLYGAIIKSSELKTSEFIDYLKINLEKMNKELWIKEFEKNHYNLFNLLIILVEKNFKPDLKSEFKDVLSTFIIKIQNKELDPNNLKEKWPKYLNALDNDHRTSFMDTIRHIIIHENKDFSSLVILFENILIDCNLFKDYSNELINIGFHSILGRENENELKWMLSILSSCQSKINWHSSKFMNPLIDRIKNRITSMNETEEKKENVNRILNQIAKELGINFDKD